MSITRKTTNALLEMIDQGAIDPTTVVQMCLSYMSEADVADMCSSNDINFDDEEDEEEDEES